MKTVLLTIIAIAFITILGGIGFIYTGAFNVAATQQDSALMHWLLRTAREESIDRRAEDVIPPAAAVMTDSQTLRIGFEHYNEMCVMCHGAPGIDAGEARAGLNPKPPLLTKAAKHIPPQELFWVIKHGIKMTGMPAWGPTHSDEKIWAMVAFVKKLPDMTPEQYQAMQQQLASEGEPHEHSHAGAAHQHDTSHEHGHD